MANKLENVQEEGVREAAGVEAKTGGAIEAVIVEVVTTEVALAEVGHYIEETEGGEEEVMNIESSPKIRGTII